jgi:transcriptional regulator with PAS, ATPase and Fis domain
LHGVHSVWRCFCKVCSESEEQMVAETPQTFRRTEQPDPELIFGKTARMGEVRSKLECAVQDGLPVLIEGESGTGKEVVARFLHWQSTRREGPFVKVNCAAVPARLLEAEMFGWGIGAPGAKEGKKDAIALAFGGTLFLDEIGEMDSVLRCKLIGTLQTGRYNHPDLGQMEVNARIVCACSMDLDSKRAECEEISQLLRSFAHRVRLLPLRERKADIPWLCEYLVEKFARNFGRPAPQLSQSVLDAFSRWDWPGNIRELENWIARIVLFGMEEAMGAEYGRLRGSKVDGVSRRHRATSINMSLSRRTRRSR